MDTKLKIRSKKYLKGAKDQSCVNCGVNDGTIVSAHYQGLRSHLYGKGTGTKPHDLLVADLCHKCHTIFDSQDLRLRHNTLHNRNWRKCEVSEEFLHCIALTLIRRAQQGIIYTDDMRGTGEREDGN